MAIKCDFVHGFWDLDAIFFGLPTLYALFYEINMKCVKLCKQA